ncbi:unnamed protein product [Closterium sp. Naga37s-1]|nr:unnamed protein product [Closterium sp. Naga37s-1]CAI5494309.1 unnamed protein product [Closterium sp. Naga37s-1]
MANSWLHSARKLLPLTLSVLLLFAVTNASAARPILHASPSDTSADSAVSPHRVERKLFSWDGVTVDQIIAGSLGTIDGPEDDEGDPASAQVEVWHFWDNSEFKVFYKQGPFSVENLGNGGYENWAFGGNWVRYGADEKVVVFS